MWELNSVWADDWSFAPSVASYQTVMPEIHVLLVEHDSDNLINTVELLEMCRYRVTFVELASAAVSLLLSGKAKFDVVIADINSPDLHGFKLLQLAVSMGLSVVLMSSIDDNELTAVRALQTGALLYIKKPATMEIMKCLWQHVLREKIRPRKPRVASHGNVTTGAVEFHPREENPNHNYYNNDGNDVVFRQKRKYKEVSNGGRHHEDHEETRTRQHPLKRKICTEWTQELHHKFMDAVAQLGEGKCFPKEILHIMKVPGLTRMQVASHLQKCRNYNWRLPKERKFQATAAAESHNSVDNHRPRRFGCMPQLGNFSQQQANSDNSSEVAMAADSVGGDGDDDDMNQMMDSDGPGNQDPDPTGLYHFNPAGSSQP